MTKADQAAIELDAPEDRDALAFTVTSASKGRDPEGDGPAAIIGLAIEGRPAPVTLTLPLNSRAIRLWGFLARAVGLPDHYTAASFLDHLAGLQGRCMIEGGGRLVLLLPPSYGDGPAVQCPMPGVIDGLAA